MRRIRTCRNCRDGVRVKLDDGQPAVMCALAPPVLRPDNNYFRPMMKPLGWCGQFTPGLSNLLSRSYG